MSLLAGGIGASVLGLVVVVAHCVVCALVAAVDALSFDPDSDMCVSCCCRGVAAGLLAQTLCYPGDTLRRHLQARIYRVSRRWLSNIFGIGGCAVSTPAWHYIPWSRDTAPRCIAALPPLHLPTACKYIRTPTTRHAQTNGVNGEKKLYSGMWDCTKQIFQREVRVA
jgi:hypothetical protein